MSRQDAVVIMAAGLGTRMKSDTAKVLHPVAGRPLIYYPVRTALDLGAARVVVVLGHQRAPVEEYLARTFEGAPVFTALQAEQLGTAHAVLCAREALADFDGDVTILSGDVPGLTRETLFRLAEAQRGAAVGLVVMDLPDAAAYGRALRGPDGRVTAVVEARDCTALQLRITEANAGVYRVDARFLFATLAGLGTDNAQGELYLPDIVAAAHRAGAGVADVLLTGDAAEEVHGVNDRVDLAAVEARAQRGLRRALMRAGVTLIDPTRVWLHDGVEVGPDTVIEPGVALLGATRVGRRCTLEQGVRLEDTTVGDGTVVHACSTAQGARIDAGCHVGPFARLREGTRLHDGVKVGNFVETKKAELHAGAKASHLSYLGDVEVGERANIGAGTITCNYDGKDKFRTVIGAGAFIGSDTQLVAPVTVGAGAFVGAGTTLTRDVPDDALATSRVRQKNNDGWATRRRQRQTEGG